MSPARFTLPLAAVLCLVASMACAQDGERAEDVIRKALSQPALESFHDQPLEQVIAGIARVYEIPVVLDRRAFEENGFDPSVEVSLDVSGLSLRSSLDLMLRPVELVWTVHADVLYITTRDAEEELLITKVYNVRDLVLPESEVALIKPVSAPDFQSLLELITTAIAPNTWDDLGGPGSVREFQFDGTYAVIISQTYRHHEQIARLLADLRGLADMPGAAGGIVHSRSRFAVPRRYAPSPAWARPHVHE